MDSSKPRRFVLRSTSAVSLNERFSQVLVDQLIPTRSLSFDTIVVPSSPSVVLVVNKEPRPLPGLQHGVGQLVSSVSSRVKLHRRRSVWSRLGWRRGLSRSKPRGFWSFRNKYKWRSRFSSTYRRRSNLPSGLGQYRLMSRTNVQNQAAGQNPRLHLQTDAATAGTGQRKHNILTRKQLDAQLDEYMSLSKSRLDQQLDDYMSMSRQRLDAELEEYMLMAGHWD